jgi:hypothetical protein
MRAICVPYACRMVHVKKHLRAVCVPYACRVRPLFAFLFGNVHIVRCMRVLCVRYACRFGPTLLKWCRVRVICVPYACHMRAVFLFDFKDCTNKPYGHPMRVLSVPCAFRCVVTFGFSKQMPKSGVPYAFVARVLSCIVECV